jgi:HAD superfamily hydrolase (TIGR01509 family)
MHRMPKGCVIFDFDGVIADTERLHLAAYNQTLAVHAADIGGPLHVSEADYFREYIVYGDHEGLFHILNDHGRPTEGVLIRKLAAAKHALFEKQLHAFAEPLAGVRELVAWLGARNVPTAICSGARRGEIELLLAAFGLRHNFKILVTIEDVRQGKPEPEGYNLAFDKLNLEYDAELDRNLSLVIEDSAGGCAAGKAAGMRVLGVATSIPLSELARCATHAVESLNKLDFAQLAAWLDLRA